MLQVSLHVVYPVVVIHMYCMYSCIKLLYQLFPLWLGTQIKILVTGERERVTEFS